MRIASNPIVDGDIEYNIKDGEYKKDELMLRENSKRLLIQATAKMIFDLGCRLIWVFSFKDIFRGSKLLLRGTVYLEYLHRKEISLSIDTLKDDVLQSFNICRNQFHIEIQQKYGLSAKVSDLSESDALDYAHKLFGILEPLRGQ